MDIYGSCVSRIPFLEGNLTATGCMDPRIKINKFYDRHPILSCMTPIPNTEILNELTIESISKEELYDKSDRQVRSVKQELLKSTLPLMKESNAEFLVFDLYSFHSNLIVYKDTMFSPYSYEFFNTKIYQENPSEFSQMFFPLDLPMGIWWGYVKSFFDFVFKKYRSDHVIMLRFTACSSYLSKDKKVLPIPERCKRPWMANVKYNRVVRELEDKIIKLYHPHVIDYSKYYIGDENLHEQDVQGAHYEKEYYIESFKAIKKIIFKVAGNMQKNITCDELRLSNSGIARILSKEIPQDEFIKMWTQIESPLRALREDAIFGNLANVSDAEIIRNRFLIGELFNLADTMSYALENCLFSAGEKKYLFLKGLKSLLWNGLLDGEKELIIKVFGVITDGLDFANETYEDSFENIFNKFSVLLENNNLAWIEYLRYAEKLQPNNPVVIQYMLYYAQAIEDNVLIRLYEQRLKEAQ